MYKIKMQIQNKIIHTVLKYAIQLEMLLNSLHIYGYENVMVNA